MIASDLKGIQGIVKMSLFISQGENTIEEKVIGRGD
jgi:hypothetical protein